MMEASNKRCIIEAYVNGSFFVAIEYLWGNSSPIKLNN